MSFLLILKDEGGQLGLVTHFTPEKTEALRGKKCAHDTQLVCSRMSVTDPGVFLPIMPHDHETNVENSNTHCLSTSKLPYEVASKLIK